MALFLVSPSFEALVSGDRRQVVMRTALHGGWRPPAPVRGERRPSALRPHPRMSFGTARRSVTHDRTVARLSIAWTRQVTVTDIICGVDVSSKWLDARIGRNGRSARFANDREGVEALAEFCQAHK